MDDDSWIERSRSDRPRQKELLQLQTETRGEEREDLRVRPIP